MFGIFKKTDRYNELYDHLINKWGMKSGFAAAFLNEYRNALATQYEKGLTFHRQAIMSQPDEVLESIFLSLRDTTLVSQAYLAYMNDLRSGKYVGTNIEKAIWAILITNRRIINPYNALFYEYLEKNVIVKFPNLIDSVFNNLDYLIAADLTHPQTTHPNAIEKTIETQDASNPTAISREKLNTTTRADEKTQLSQPEKYLKEKILDEKENDSILPRQRKRLDNDQVYRSALSYVCYRIKLNGFEVINCGNSRGDDVSIIARHEDQDIYILVAAAQHPKEPFAPQFMIDRLVSRAKVSGADYYIALVSVRTTDEDDETKTQPDSKNNSLSYKFSGLQKP